MEDGENRFSFIKNVEITDGKADTMHSALSSEIEKCGGVGFESIIDHKNVASILKRDNTKMISIHCHNYWLALAIPLLYPLHYVVFVRF